MTERNARYENPLEGIHGSFNINVDRLRTEILELFQYLHAHLDDKKDLLLWKLNQMMISRERNIDAEQAIRQLEATMESILVTISSNLLREKKELYTETIARDVADYKNKIEPLPNIETIHPIYDKVKFDEALKSIQLTAAKLDFKAKPKMIKDGSHLKRPRGVAVSKDKIYIADRYDFVKVFSTNGEYLQNSCIGKGHLHNPWGIAIWNDIVYVTDAGQKQISKYKMNGELVKRVGWRGNKNGEFVNPRGLAAVEQAVYVCDQGNNRVQVLSPDLDFITVIAKEGMIDPVDVHVKDGDVIVLPLNHNRVFVFDAEGNCIATVQLNSDQVMRDTYFFTVNRWGYILVSSRLEGCIKTFSPEGEFIRETGRGQANDCYGVSMTESDGIVCVANASNNGSIQIYY